LPLTASAARVWFPLRVRSPTPRFSDQMSAVYSERTGLVRERKACRTRSSESPRVIATASARKSLSRAWRPGIHSCMISSTAQNATPPIYKVGRPSDMPRRTLFRRRQMLEQVGKSGYRPESRRHYGHNESRARNEPGARAQYQISHGTAAEWDNEPVGLRWGDGGVQVSRNLEVNTGTSDARAANRAIHARPRHGGRQFPSRSSVLISCGLRDHPLCRMRLPR
jgi:hypothetical protein